jgi:hypothetical protein
MKSVMDANNYYIGGFVAAQTDLQMNSHEIHFRDQDWETVGTEDDGSPIAELTDRHLVIELSDSGDVIQVTGTTSRLDQGVVCTIKK